MDTGDKELERIYALAEQCRSLIEASRRDELSVPMRCFPSGSCEPTCLHLEAWLSKFDETGFQLKGCFWSEPGGNHWSHIWLQRDDLIVDITADQFDSCNNGVIVSRSSDWHYQLALKGELKDIAPFEWPAHVIDDHSKIFGDS